MHTGNLLGALECLDSGVTTVQDFSHVQYTPEHSAAAVEALEEAGIRAVFGYGYPVFDDTARQADWVRRPAPATSLARRAAHDGPGSGRPLLRTTGDRPGGLAARP